MVGIPNKQSNIKALLLFLIFIQIATSSIAVSPSNRNIGQIATYTWTIGFIGSSPYLSLSLSFPSEIGVSAATVTIGGTTFTPGIAGNIITIQASFVTTNPITIAVNNVRNPYSGVTTRNFVYTYAGGSETLAIPGIGYSGGTFTSCPWTFSLCTEQKSSELTIPITLVNNLIKDNDYYFTIGYSSSWSNLNTKNLVTANSGFICTYTVNNGPPNTGTCAVDSSNPRINFFFRTLVDLNAGANIVVKVGGVNSPPTKTTSTSTSFYIKTTDSTTSFNIIDQGNNCIINPVCVSKQTSGTLTNGTLIINGNYGNPQIMFTQTPFSVTVMASDSIQVSFSPFSSLSSCKRMYFLRAGSNVYDMQLPTTNEPIMTFTVPSTAITNNQFLSNITLSIHCTAFKLPPSETPTVLSFLFKRGNSEYMQLTHTINAVATSFNFSRAVLLSDTSMISNTSSYSFNFVIGQPLGVTPKIDLIFLASFIIGIPSCTVTIAGISVSLGTCSKSLTANIISVTFTVSNVLPIGTNITISILGITNPNSPGAYPIQAKSYYVATQSTSLVQYSTTAFIATITQISNFPMVLTPSNLTVYSTVNLTIAFTNTIEIPANSSYSVDFPIGVSSLSAPSNLLTANSTTQPFTGVTINQTTLKVTFTNGIAVPANSRIEIKIEVKTPTSMGPASFVKVLISNGAIRYISSQNSLYLDINSVNALTMTITASNPTAGAITNYIFSLNLDIPHQSLFIAEVSIPSDTTYFTTNTSCFQGCNTTAVGSATTTFFRVVVKNVGGTGSTSAIFKVSSFRNPRSVEASQQWTVSTRSVTSNSLISTTFKIAQISTPNILIASLSNDDMYTKYNSKPVKVTFKFTNALRSGDYILLSMTSNIYSATNVTCSSIYGQCSLIGPSNVTVIKIIANTTSISNGSLLVILEGLTSGVSNYLINYTIAATSFTALGKQMDTGTIIYNLTCRNQFTKNCKECFRNGSCYSCYLNEGYYLFGDTCFSSCGNVSSYLSYANNSTGLCSTCINNCATCDNAIFCKTCASNYFLYPDATCKFSCLTSAGYFNSTQGLVKLCSYCISNCLQCVNASSSCTRCNNATLLQNGICVSGCTSDSFYKLNGKCYPCNNSCQTCSGEGSGNCITCSGNFYRFNSLCVSKCPIGTAINVINQSCGCEPQCLTCSSYSYCTACLNTTLWALNGGCVDKCPDGTFQNNSQCSPCATGCLLCTINTCSQCLNTSYLFNNKCYSDCNLISQQYDVFGGTCVLCPNGCDSCNKTICTTCLPDFSLTGAQCTETCLLDDSCNLGKQVLPLPGMITIFFWAIICVGVNLIYGKNYLPYSVVLFSGMIQLVQVIALLSSLNSSTARLLATSTSSTQQMQGLLIGSLLVNYLLNLAYIVVFIKYIKPLISNPREIDIISNIVVLVIGTVTNFRFGLIAFAKMFPKPSIYIENQSKLTPVHYLCFIGMLLDILPIIACVMGVSSQNPLSNAYMLSIDILIIIILNIVLTIWMLAAKKPDQYFENDIKKYQIQDGIQNTTNQTLPNQKNYSKANMVANESFNSQDIQQTQFDMNSYKKQSFNKGESMNAFDKQSKTNSQILKNKKVKPINIKTSRKNDLGDPDPFLDPNFESNLKSKKSQLKESAIIISKFSIGNPSDRDGKSMDDNLSMKKGQVVSKNMGKGTIKTDRKNNSPKKNIAIISQTQNADLQVEQTKRQGSGSVFGADNTKITKPKRISQNKALTKSIDQPMKVMKKGDKKIGYFQSDAYESNADNEDIEQIIKQKIWQSTVKLQRQSQSFHRQSTQDAANQQISPSWFNIQNQRLQLQDFEEDSDPQ